MDAQEFYDGLGDDYDRMVSWEARLAREEAFFRAAFQQNGAHSVLDAACGTGMHAIRFARWGLASAGADLSPAMIGKARENARAAGVDVVFRVAAFGELSANVGGPVDAVTCLGNSLPHLLDDDALHACCADFAAALRPEGMLVIQNRNYDRLLKERQRFAPVAARSEGDEETLFVRITDFPTAPSAEAVQFTILTLRKRGGQWSQSAQSTPLRAIRRESLEGALRAAGFGALATYGSFSKEPFDPGTSSDLIVVARR
jgi:glycine/sarcosine N-methyltransferase